MPREVKTTASKPALPTRWRKWFARRSLLAAVAFTASADAQVVLIPHGNYESDFEKHLVVIVTLVLFAFAILQSYKNGQLDWFRRLVRKIFGRGHR